MTSLQLNNLRRKAAFYEHDAPEWVKNLWPRPESFDWFVKHHRDALLAQGAMIKLGRDYFVDVERFPAAASRILGVAPGDGDGQTEQRAAA